MANYSQKYPVLGPTGINVYRSNRKTILKHYVTEALTPRLFWHPSYTCTGEIWKGRLLNYNFCLLLWNTNNYSDRFATLTF